MNMPMHIIAKPIQVVVRTESGARASANIIVYPDAAIAVVSIKAVLSADNSRVQAKLALFFIALWLRVTT